jgi:hypothetical protein
VITGLAAAFARQRYQVFELGLLMAKAMKYTENTGNDLIDRHGLAQWLRHFCGAVIACQKTIWRAIIWLRH